MRAIRYHRLNVWKRAGRTGKGARTGLGSGSVVLGGYFSFFLCDWISARTCTCTLMRRVYATGAKSIEHHVITCSGGTASTEYRLENLHEEPLTYIPFLKSLFRATENCIPRTFTHLHLGQLTVRAFKDLGAFFHLSYPHTCKWAVSSVRFFVQRKLQWHTLRDTHTTSNNYKETTHHGDSTYCSNRKDHP